MYIYILTRESCFSRNYLSQESILAFVFLDTKILVYNPINFMIQELRNSHTSNCASVQEVLSACMRPFLSRRTQLGLFSVGIANLVPVNTICQ